jgi:hypothetical protein
MDPRLASVIFLNLQAMPTYCSPRNAIYAIHVPYWTVLEMPETKPFRNVRDCDSDTLGHNCANGPSGTTIGPPAGVPPGDVRA